MKTESLKNRFIETMEEIAHQVKDNSKIIHTGPILNIIESILQTKKENNRIFMYGAGRSGFIGRCFAQRLMHLGINSCFISDAVTYQYTKMDLLILISGSGETTSPVALAQKAKEIGGKIALFTNNPNNTIAKLSDWVVEVKGKSKNVAMTQKTLAPYTSLFDISTLSLLDSIGGLLMNVLELTESDIDKSHASLE